MVKKIQTLIMVILLFTATELAAQTEATAPGAIQQQTRQTLEYYRLERKVREGLPPKSEDEKVIRQKQEAPQEETRKPSARIWIEKILINESKILSQEELKKVTEKYEGRECTISELFEAVAAINALYADKRFFVAKAILPPQKVEKGNVRIELVEGRLGEFKIEGNTSTRDSFILNRMSLKQEDLIRLDTFEKDILYLNRTNDIDVRAKLKPGKIFGRTDAVLTVDEPQEYEVILFSDNAGRETTGKERGGIIFSDKSLLGFRDALDINLVGAQGTVAGSLSYDFPVNKYATRLGLSYDRNQIEYITGPLQSLDMAGDSNDFGIRVTHPFLVRQWLTLNGYLAYHYKDSNTEFGDVTLFETTADDFSLGFDFKSRDKKGAWIFNNALTYGRDNYGDDREYVIYNLDLIRVHFFNDMISGIFRGSGQISDSDLLPSFDLFQIGGMSTVRGYPEGLLAGDNGYYTSAELTVALPFVERLSKNKLTRNDVKFFIFLDHGGTFPYKGNDESINSDDFLTSAGFGFDFKFTQYFSGRISCGIPLVSRDDNQDGASIHFYIQSKLY